MRSVRKAEVAFEAARLLTWEYVAAIRAADSTFATRRENECIERETCHIRNEYRTSLQDFYERRPVD